MTRARSFITHALLSAGALVCAMAAVELGLRVFRPLEIHRYSDAIRVTAPIRLPLGQTIPHVKPSIVFTANKFGFRTRSVNSKLKPEGTIRVLCVGASTTLSEPQNTEDTWCARLETKLKALGIGNVETAAFGRDGWRAVHLLDWTVHNALDYHPDIVITLMGVNDLAFAGGAQWKPADLDAVVHADLLPDAVRQRCAARLPGVICAAVASRGTMAAFEACAEHLQWCRLIAGIQPVQNSQRATTLEWHSGNLPHLRAMLAAQPYSASPQREPDPIDEFSAAMDRLVAYLTAARVSVIMLGQPTLWSSELSQAEKAALWFPVTTRTGWVRTDPGWLDAEMQRYNARQRDIARARHAAYVDLDGRIPKNLDYFFDDCHYTDAGSDKMASEILPAVQDLLRQRRDAVIERTR